MMAPRTDALLQLHLEDMAIVKQRNPADQIPHHLGCSWPGRREASAVAAL
ncbi:hypothetical protein GNY90_22425 [Aeromonas hydrophila]|nr:hypothetical protein [Aeromonas hydrophila]MBW3834722.1 hypothetical protein [Aeromonas hydrophila]MBW5280386.1 hypothetical protein [Aeromonas hydrophila]